MQESFLNSPLIYSIALTLIHFLWQGVLVALVLKTILIFTSNQKSQLRYTYSVFAMILNLVLPLITFFIIYKPQYLQLTEKLSQTSIADLAFIHTTSKQGEWYSNIVEYLPYLTVAWLCIISVLSLKLLIELYAVNQLPKHDTLTPDTNLLNRFKRLSTQVGVQKIPDLLLSLNTNVPMAIGWIKPIVLIPVSMLTGLTPNQLDMLMLHELAHIRRHDYVVNFIQSIIEIILFFHPCVLWVSNQMRNEREYCSDDIAVKHCGNPIAYAHTLADTASLCSKHRDYSIPNMAMAASGGDLTQRVLRLVNEHHCAASNQVSKWFASLTILSIILFVSSQQLFNLLEIEINSSNYNPKITILNSPLPTNTGLTNIQEVFNKNSDLPTKNNDLKLNAQKTSIETLTSVERKETIDFEKVISTPRTETVTNEIPQNVVSDIEAKLTTTQSRNIKDLTNTNKKSTSELAFEQTNSNSSSSLMSNPYSKQLNELGTDINENISRMPAEKVKTNNTRKHLNQTQPIKPTSTIVTPLAKMAELVYSIPPRYPSTAKRKGIELEIKVDFTIDKKGRVKNIIFPTIKHKMNYFKTAIRLALEKWRFIPANNNGKAIDSKMSKIFSFNLHK